MKNLLKIGRHRWNSIIFVLVVAAFITFAPYIAYYRQTLRLIDMASWPSVLFFLTMPVVITAFALLDKNKTRQARVFSTLPFRYLRSY